MHKPSLIARIFLLTAVFVLARAMPVGAQMMEAQLQHKYRSYDYQETAENMLKQVRVTIPEGLTTVRGLLVVSNAAGGDTRDSYNEGWFAEFLYMHDFAFIGTKGFTSHIESFQAFQHALKQIAAESNHPELVNVPYVTEGFSAGGGFASRLLVEAPDRVIACVPISSRLNFTGMTPNAAQLHTPALIISGGNEANVEKMVEPVLEAYRPQGALYGWMTVQGGVHARYGQEVLAMPYLDAVVRLRYPSDGDVRKAPLKLKPIDPDTGWIADNTTWTSGLTRISPAKQFAGAIAKSSWLPTEDIAYIYRAYATYDRPLAIISPSTAWSQNRVWDPGSSIPIAVDVSKYPNWRKLEFFDGAYKLGEVTSGTPQFTAVNLRSGYHVFSVLGTDEQGIARTSNPVLAVVRVPQK
jgi:pimeloyl-ACP methyl ester carboxylesterase